MGELGKIPARVAKIRRDYVSRDARYADVRAIRRGDFEKVAPDLFSEKIKKPLVANLIDTSARTFAASLAPLPSFTCSSSAMLSDRQKEIADKRSKIVANYVKQSRLARQMHSAADWYPTYGLLIGCVLPDYDKGVPVIQMESPLGSYPVLDSWGDCVEYARVYRRPWLEVVADYPELEGRESRYGSAVKPDGSVEVVKYVNDSRMVVYLPEMGNYPLIDIPNPLGRCNYVVGQRPGADDEVRGVFDDVIFVQLARHQLQLMLMNGVAESVYSPIAVPDDVDEIPLGKGALLRTRNPQGIARVRMEVPPQAFAAVQELAQELREGAMTPESMSGNIDASVITGRGVQQLMAGFNEQIAAAQAVFTDFFERVIALCFEVDEKVFPDLRKEIRGQDAGVPYSAYYVASRDINGDHTVDVSYGFAAGLDPNRALVFLLQAHGAGAISTDYLRRNLPVGINPIDEELKIAVEQSRDAIVQAWSATAQSMPQLIANGQDPSQIILKQAQFIKLIQGGKPPEEAVLEVLAPEPRPGSPESQAEAGSGAQGFNDAGLPGDLQPGLATEGPGGRPDLNMLFAGMTSGGNPNLQAGVSRYAPTSQ